MSTLILTPAQPNVLRGRPHTILTLSFNVSNRGDRPATIERELELEAGFEQLGPQLPFQVRPGETERILAHVRVPYSAAGGGHSVRLVLRDRGDSAVCAVWGGTLVAG